MLLLSGLSDIIFILPVWEEKTEGFLFGEGGRKLPGQLLL
jgi:hypothetical protein